MRRVEALAPCYVRRDQNKFIVVKRFERTRKQALPQALELCRVTPHSSSLIYSFTLVAAIKTFVLLKRTSFEVSPAKIPRTIKCNLTSLG